MRTNEISGCSIRRMIMYLKRLETVGFKSFAERVHIDFVPGVTAIVGPNGSGKSNITDAIRWVLGEQSIRSLRGTRMEDIIFQGSDTRNALNVAEVTLVLDNRDQFLPLDYEEVSVTRRVYRSGASEFYLNKQSCRLKDIVDLFMDSGLGREAFSIISQGQVEKILSSKAEDRRAIFEEAAGVLKYKHRKQEAEFKLQETEDNLHRVDDIIYEIEQQIDPLREQAEIAETYLRKREQLKQHEISLLITEIYQLHHKWQSLLQTIEQEQLQEIERKTAIQQKEAQLEVERKNLEQLDQEIEQLQQELLTSTKKLEQLEGHKQVSKERKKHYLENKQNILKRKEQVNKRIEELSEQYEQEQINLKKLAHKQSEMNATIDELKQKLSTSSEDIHLQLENLKSEYIEQLNDQAAKRNETRSIYEQIQQLKAKASDQTESYSEMKQQQQNLTAQTEKLSIKRNDLEKTYEKQFKHLKQKKQLLTKHQDKLVKAEKQLSDRYQTLAKLTSKKEMLEEMKEDFQGFFQGVRSVLKAREHHQLTNIEGAVIELIDVPKQYVQAIETVLGAQAQQIVVTDEQAARLAIDWLKRTNNGRATFLPLQSIQKRFVPESLLAKIYNHSGFIGIASNLVHTESKYQTVIEHLMGNVFITKTLRDANEIAHLTNRKYRVVTLEGDVVFPGGSMAGGSTKRNRYHSLFTREKDLENVSKQLQRLRKQIKTFEGQLEKQQTNIFRLKETIQTEENALIQTQEELQEIETTYDRIQMQQSTLSDQINRYQIEEQQFDRDLQHLNERRKTLERELQVTEKNLSTLQQRIDHLTTEQENFDQRQKQLQEEIHEHDILLAELEERYRNQMQQTKGIQKQLQEAKQDDRNFDEQLQELLSLQKKEETIETLDQRIAKHQQTINQLEEKIQMKRKKRLERMKYIEYQEREVREDNKQHESFLQQLQEKEVKANRLDVELENRLSQLQTDYSISYERAKETYEQTENPIETKKIVDNIKQEIKQLGRVNLGAIDEHKRLSERYTFLTEQKEDLMKAKQSLYQVIHEMDEEMKQRFQKTFTQIRKEFSLVFQELFGGGHAELNLTDPDYLLTTGIEIISQPPGKKLQNLDLLSGGERALTAIALLFAILRVRPVPFCVLDEVEASLDEANVSRFADYINMHSADTQFIVITHRKGTMEKSDVLYGVTMQESGVSRLVSVRLEETEEFLSTS